MAISGLTGWFGTMLSTPDPPALAAFYSGILGWEIFHADDDSASIGIPGTTCYLGFHVDKAYERPVWPSQHGVQQMQSHLDIGVRDVAAAVEGAIAAGAVLAEHQPRESVRVMLDPDGHPFCLYLDQD